MAREYRLTANQIAVEKSYVANLRNIANYTSLNADYSVAALQTIVDELDAALAEESQMKARLAEIRNAISAKGTALTKRNDGAVQQVVAQFGDDSPEYQSLGRRRRSDRRSGLVRPGKSNGQPVG